MKSRKHHDATRRDGKRTLWTLIGLAAAAAVGLGWGFGLFDTTTSTAEEVVVYKSPSCGCCGNWSSHLRRNGFKVTVVNVEDMDPLKQRYGVGDELESCHTAVVSGYVVEGHVPAADIRRLLSERPAVTGLAVPGMPAAAPGMDDSDGEPFNVLTFDAKGRGQIYARY